MLEHFIRMVSQADMLVGYEKRNDVLSFYGEDVEVIIVKVNTSDTGDYVEAVFHAGTEVLIDMNVHHECRCGGHCNH